MSTTYSIGCRQCRKHLWIAQSSQESTTLYAGQNYTPALKDFLFEHIGHPLVFNENCESELADWEEIEIEKPATNLLNPQVEWVPGDKCPVKPPSTVRSCLITADFGSGLDVTKAFYSVEAGAWIINGHERPEVKVLAWMDEPTPFGKAT
jgi:hypothetical protein